MNGRKTQKAKNACLKARKAEMMAQSESQKAILSAMQAFDAANKAKESVTKTTVAYKEARIAAHMAFHFAQKALESAQQSVVVTKALEFFSPNDAHMKVNGYTTNPPAMESWYVPINPFMKANG